MPRFGEITMVKKKTGRKPRDISSTTGMAAPLALLMQQLRPEDLPLKQLRERTGLSLSALSKVTNPHRVASWQTMTAYLTALGEDPNHWRPVWEKYADDKQRRAAGLPELPEQRAVYQRMLPQHVVDLEGFAIGMLDLVVMQNMPYKQIVSRARQAGASLSMATISDVCNGKKLPTQSTLEGILLGLGFTEADAEYNEWFQARYVLDATRRREKLQAKDITFRNSGLPRRVRKMRTRVRGQD
jgi:transcriptional regulator with XRE-family HTH domain